MGAQNTAAAVESIRIAKGYYDRLFQDPKLTATEQTDCLKFAAHHLAAARTADPTAVLLIDGKNGTERWTQDFLCAQVLYHQSVMEAAPEDEAGCLKALETLKQATAFAPDTPFIHRGIAETLLKLNRRDEAIVAAEFALALRPDDFASRLLVDKIKTTPTLGVKEVPPGTTEKKLGCALMIAAVVGFCTIPSLIASAIPGSDHDWPIIWTVIGLGVLFWIGFKLREWGEGTTYLHNASRKDRYK